MLRQRQPTEITEQAARRHKEVDVGSPFFESRTPVLPCTVQAAWGKITPEMLERISARAPGNMLKVIELKSGNFYDETMRVSSERELELELVRSSAICMCDYFKSS